MHLNDRQIEKIEGVWNTHFVAEKNQQKRIECKHIHIHTYIHLSATMKTCIYDLWTVSTTLKSIIAFLLMMKIF